MDERMSREKAQKRQIHHKSEQTERNSFVALQFGRTAAGCENAEYGPGDGRMKGFRAA
jgi:hypothetical protein